MQRHHCQKQTINLLLTLFGQEIILQLPKLPAPSKLLPSTLEAKAPCKPYATKIALRLAPIAGGVKKPHCYHPRTIVLHEICCFPEEACDCIAHLQGSISASCL